MHTTLYWGRYPLTSDKVVLFVSVNVLGPLPESSSVSCWCMFLHCEMNKIDTNDIHYNYI